MKKAFTLIELIVVVAIVAIIIAVAFPIIFPGLNKGKQTQAQLSVYIPQVIPSGTHVTNTIKGITDGDFQTYTIKFDGSQGEGTIDVGCDPTGCRKL